MNLQCTTSAFQVLLKVDVSLKPTLKQAGQLTCLVSSTGLELAATQQAQGELIPLTSGNAAADPMGYSDLPHPKPVPE